MRPLIINTEKTSFYTVAASLWSDDSFSLVQKGILQHLISYQAKGEIAFLSQSDFSSKNHVGRNKVSSEIKDLEERNIITNLGQMGKGLPCRFKVDLGFMIGLGYELVEQQGKEPTVSDYNNGRAPAPF